MEEYKISVIVPVYKVEEYLNKCVDSIINQTYKNLEIILVDDGSPDSCGKICDEYAKKDSRIKVIHKENGGVSSARNAGLDVATGDYIGFVDSDDWIEPNMYEFLIKKCLYYNTDIARCEFIDEYDFNISDKNISLNENYYIIENSDNIIIDIIKGSWSEGVLCNKLYKSSLLRNIRLKNDLKYCEDLLFNYYVMKKANKIFVSNIKKYHYFRRNDSVTGVQISESSFDMLKVANIIISNEIDNREIYIYAVRRIVRNCIVLINSCIINNLYKDKVSYMRNIIRKYIDNIKNDNVYTFKEKTCALIICYMLWLYIILIKINHIRVALKN
ncbi:hypothetical protein B5E58_10520 [Tyzzerella sp. An114]|uniref:glycosyltransferase n=1 Tax=Tyzzerella sp. An114 TaxID=1965545 RepID=UPI000B45482D|nr:glycosyltransferase [Tyzzerella sp. An114]OUQ56650.1 hypothetical protein B5E58_10520 [Tyzzerella sp. An114]